MSIPSRLRALTAPLLASALLLSACGSSDAGGTPAAQSGDGAFPVSIENAFGTTEIPQEPQRVLTLGVTDADHVIALGVTPIATAGYQFYETNLGPWAEEALEGEAPGVLETDSEPDLEQIATYEPDLIIAVSSGIDDAAYEQLTQIAPVVARPAEYAAYTVPREEQTALVGRALGLDDEAAAINAEVEELLADTREAHPEFAEATGAVVLPYDNQYGAFLPGDARGQFLTEIGFFLPEAILDKDTGESFFVEVPTENASWLDGDLILVLGEDPTGDLPNGEGVFAGLKAAQDDAIVQASEDQRGAITYNSPLSLPFAIDSLVPELSDALAD